MIVGFAIRRPKRRACRVRHADVSVRRVVVLSAAEPVVKAIVEIWDRDRLDDETM